MPIQIISLSIGPMDNNTYLLADSEKRTAVVVDPSFESHVVLEEARKHGWQITAVWLTHAHFDHIAGLSELNLDGNPVPLPVGLHPADLPLYRRRGDALRFGIQLPPLPEPSIQFEHGQKLMLGSHSIEVRHTPGHTSGHVIFYLPAAAAAICGDLIFYRGVGRTDLPGASHQQLLRSIQTQVFTLPPQTRLLCGHGSETSVEEEQNNNPFLI